MVVWFRGRVAEEADAMINISSETAQRGGYVFEGIRAYWNPNFGVGILRLRSHLTRLFSSAQVLAIPHSFSEGSFRSAIATLLRHNQLLEADSYIRPSICIDSGRLATDPGFTVFDHVVCIPRDRRDLKTGLSAIISKWRRPQDSSMPPQVKSGGGYLAFRLPLLDRARAGVDHVLVLNEAGRVSEAEGAAVLAVDGTSVVAIPSSEGALESITKDVVRHIAGSLGVPFTERPISPSQLYRMDAVFLAGTLTELAPIEDLDGLRFDTSSNEVYLAIAQEFDRLRSGMVDGGLDRIEGA